MNCLRTGFTRGEPCGTGSLFCDCLQSPVVCCGFLPGRRVAAAPLPQGRRHARQSAGLTSQRGRGLRPLTYPLLKATPESIPIPFSFWRVSCPRLRFRRITLFVPRPYLFIVKSADEIPIYIPTPPVTPHHKSQMPKHLEREMKRENRTTGPARSATHDRRTCKPVHAPRIPALYLNGAARGLSARQA